MLYLLGGGWTIGSLDSFHRVCRRPAAGSGCALAALDYRLAPEHPWPAAVDDTVDALRRIALRPPELGEQTGRVAVVGDSAGGTLAALAWLRLRTAPGLLPDLQATALATTATSAGPRPDCRPPGRRTCQPQPDRPHLAAETGLSGHPRARRRATHHRAEHAPTGQGG